MYNSYLFAGVDVSADWLDAARQFGDGSNGSPDSRAPEHRRFANTADGHDALCRWLTAAGRPAHVVTEASGVYGIDLALALYEAAGVEVMVLNPRAADPALSVGRAQSDEQYRGRASTNGTHNHCCDDRLNPPNTFPSGTPSGSRRRGSSRRWDQGDSYDHALAESVIELFKTEVIRQRCPWRSLEDVEFDVLEWVWGSTIAASSNRLAIFPRPSTRRRSTAAERHKPSRRYSTNHVSEKAGAVHTMDSCIRCVDNVPISYTTGTLAWQRHCSGASRLLLG